MEYEDLARLAEQILEIGEGDIDALVRALDRLDPEVQTELMESDFLNAWQVFYFFFRTVPSDLIRDRLELVPASSVLSGVLVEEMDLYLVIFGIHEGVPCVAVGDGERILARFTGRAAYQAALRYIESEL